MTEEGERVTDAGHAGEVVGVDMARKTCGSVTVAEPGSEMAGHGDENLTTLKRSLIDDDLSDPEARCKRARIGCSFGDDVWDRVADKLLKDSIKAVARLGKTCRQLRRVVHKSGLWAWLLAIILPGAKVADDNRSAVFEDGLQLRYDRCKETVEAIGLMLSRRMFRRAIAAGIATGGVWEVIDEQTWKRRHPFPLFASTGQYMELMRRRSEPRSPRINLIDDGLVQLRPRALELLKSAIEVEYAQIERFRARVWERGGCVWTPLEPRSEYVRYEVERAKTQIGRLLSFKDPIKEAIVVQSSRPAANFPFPGELFGR